MAQQLSPQTSLIPGSYEDNIVGGITASIVQLQEATDYIISSTTPYGSNDTIVRQIGAGLNIPPKEPTDSTVSLSFAGGSAGLIIPANTLISDVNNTWTYSLVNGVILNSAGTGVCGGVFLSGSETTLPPANSLTVLKNLQYPNLTVTNPAPAVEFLDKESTTAYKRRILQGNQRQLLNSYNTMKVQLTQLTGVDDRRTGIYITSGNKIQCCVYGGLAEEIGYQVLNISSSPYLTDNTGLLNPINQTLKWGNNTFVVKWGISTKYNLTLNITISTSTPLSTPDNEAPFFQSITAGVLDYINDIALGQPILVEQLRCAIITTGDAYLGNRSFITNVSIVFSKNGNVVTPVENKITASVDEFFLITTNDISYTAP